MQHRTLTVIRTLALATAGWLAMTPAQANHYKDVCTRSDSKSLNQPIHIPVQFDYVEDDVKVGEAYGPWFRHHITWTCIRTPDLHRGSTYQPAEDYFEARTRYYPDGAVQNGELFAADPSFRIYHYGSTIGFIARITQHIDGQPPQTTPVNAPVGTVITTEFKDNVARKAGDVSKFHFTLEVRMVKQKKPPIKNAKPLFLVNNFDSTDRSEHDDHKAHKKHKGKKDWKQRSHMYNYLVVDVNRIQPACITPSQTVPLGNVGATTLQAPGSAGPLSGFNLRFEQCPPHKAGIDYKLQPVYGLASSIPGTLRLDPASSSATGVGVQVLLADGITPMTFNQPYPLAAYDPHNTDPSVVYQVPLQARIVRTDGPLQSGTVEAAMTVVATYR